jgi:hypothetical protein
MDELLAGEKIPQSKQRTKAGHRPAREDSGTQSQKQFFLELTVEALAGCRCI